MTKLEAIQQRDAEDTAETELLRKIAWIPEPQAEVDRRWLLGVVEKLCEALRGADSGYGKPCDCAFRCDSLTHQVCALLTAPESDQ